MQKFTPLAGLAALALVTGCQTHDRVMYDPEPVPIRSSSIRLDDGQPAAGGSTTVVTDETLAFPPAPGQSGLEGPTLIP